MVRIGLVVFWFVEGSVTEDCQGEELLQMVVAHLLEATVGHLLLVVPGCAPLVVADCVLGNCLGDSDQLVFQVR